MQPLHYACFFGQEPVVKVLLEKRAEVNIQDLEGISPLHWAALQGHASIVQQLLQHGAYPNFMEVNGNKSTPLDYAFSAEKDKCAELLMQHGGVGSEGMMLYAAIRIQSTFRGWKARAFVHNEMVSNLKREKKLLKQPKKKKRRSRS